MVIFEKDFVKIRPDWLKNPDTNANLEIDLFNEELNIACEYNGAQHYKFSSLFHKTYDDFLLQQKRDLFKYDIINKKDIMLIIVPYNIKKKNLLDYIIHECKNKRIDIDIYLSKIKYDNLFEKYSK